MAKKKTPAKATTGELTPFLEFLERHSQGSVAEDLTSQLNELVRAVAGLGKQGSLTLTLTVKPLIDGDGRSLVVEDKVKLTLPNPHRPEVYYPDVNANLSKNDPGQLGFFDDPDAEPEHREPVQEPIDGTGGERDTVVDFTSPRRRASED